MSNKKRTSAEIGTLAAKTLQNPNASAIQKTLAASAMSQISPDKSTGSVVEDKASAALRNPNSSPITKSLAGAVLSQSEKER